MKIVIASHNKGKLKEFKAILDGSGIDVVLASDIGINMDDFEETGTTYEANALAKARYVYEQSGLISVADDSGINIDALPDILGVYSARFMGSDTDYRYKNKHILDLLKDSKVRSARFTSVIALVGPTVTECFEGVVEGTISKTIDGEGGFGYDPIFIPNGYQDTYATMPLDIKNTISHRALALNKCVHFLKEHVYDA